MDMDSIKDWMFFKTIVGNFEGMLSYYFTAFSHYSPMFRRASVAMLGALGLCWVGFNLLKAPLDKMRGAAVAMGMTAGAGLLLAPTTNTDAFGDAAGNEASIGGYYSYYVLGTMTSIYRSGIESIWEASKDEAFGTGIGPVKSNLSVAYSKMSEGFAQKFALGEGSRSYVDYQTMCGGTAITLAKTSDEVTALAAVGIGANTLGMTAIEVTQLGQWLNTKYPEKQGMLMDAINGLRRLPGIAIFEAGSFKFKQREGIQFLRDMPPEYNPIIKGPNSYRIPTVDNYRFQLSGVDSASYRPQYETHGSAGSDFSDMMQTGTVQLPSDSYENQEFYPSDCADLYLIASKAMENFRKAVQADPSYENLKGVDAYNAISAGNDIAKAVADAHLKESLDKGWIKQGMQPAVPINPWVALSNTSMSAYDTVRSSYQKWMLGFKIPTMIATMALITVLLVYTFPVFALLSILYGPKILLTFLKLMALPFIVVFVNDLLLTVAANAIAYNNAIDVAINTFSPRGADLSGSMAVRYTDVIIMTAICAIELGIAKLLLWDDVRAATSFALGGDSAEKGGSAILNTATTLATLGKAKALQGGKANAAAASKVAQQAKAAGGGGGTSGMAAGSGGSQGFGWQSHMWHTDSGKAPKGFNPGGSAGGGSGGTGQMLLLPGPSSSNQTKPKDSEGPSINGNKPRP